MSKPRFLDSPPDSELVTDYDEEHFVTYLRILDAAAEGADWREVAMPVFGIDSELDPKRAKAIYDAHLARGRWMARRGYVQLGFVDKA